MNRNDRAFSLIELLVVVGILIGLSALTLATYKVIESRSRQEASRQVVMAVSASLARQAKSSVACGSASNPTMRWYWDWNGDGFVDGAPDLDPGPPPGTTPGAGFDVTAKADAVSNNYLGTLASARIAVPRAQVDAYQRPTDAWKRPLRIGIATGVYGSSIYGIWSAGKDGVDGTPDDIRSW